MDFVVKFDDVVDVRDATKVECLCEQNSSTAGPCDFCESIFHGRCLSLRTHVLGRCPSKLSQIRLTNRKVSQSGQKKLWHGFAKARKFSEINMIDLYAKYGKNFFQLRRDTHKHLKCGKFNFQNLLDSHFIQAFSEEDPNDAPSEKNQLLCGGLRSIVAAIIKPEHSDRVCETWLSLMDRIGPKAFYGVLKYVFDDKC
ncbi:MAG: hypothetical protein LBI56_02280 [Puniceicoccales bacterium]|jgi:hypothetical protein|nr:hypothetical protein [Puniceicoccales bacterium]